MVVKGIRDSLLEKLEICSDLQIEASKTLKVAEEVEIAMFGENSIFAGRDHYFQLNYFRNIWRSWCQIQK